MRKNRFEIKYIFPLEKLDQLLKYIDPFMEFDHYIDTASRVGFYQVSSVYFDSKNFEYYWSHLEGYPSRRKMRLRKYSYKNKNFYFWEIKNKIILSMQKYRLKIDANWLEKQPANEDFNQFCDALVSQYSHNDISDMIYFDVLDLKIRPVLNVTYKSSIVVENVHRQISLTVGTYLLIAAMIAHRL